MSICVLRQCLGGSNKPSMSPSMPTSTQLPHNVPPPLDIPHARPAWRTVQQRGGTRRLRRSGPEAPPPESVPEPRPVPSWVAWPPNPTLASVEPTLLVPDRGSPSLFGPRSPRDSYRD
ncbi:hypothetical protein PAXRUDRAFT_832359 [Paxillus rubicundulus Ve08.2h10]|uniref:Uncharacterized protein n=1 Tax=Paxillus rubicundulus Ve08.2h10 TaxID=930991 RepID=A0A0D0DD33_9AGAM|nr:hypothetical protein PAXRUDRAFT_832359 [Paxillus rubicundulus Ve08.2h10]